MILGRVVQGSLWPCSGGKRTLLATATLVWTVVTYRLFCKRGKSGREKSGREKERERERHTHTHTHKEKDRKKDRVKETER